jgi:hypothetical protein
MCSSSSSQTRERQYAPLASTLHARLLHLQVALVSLEEFAVAPLPAARGVVALAVQHSAGLPVLLAVAVRAVKGRSKVLVFNVLPGANLSSHQPAVLLAQVRQQLL